MSFVSRAPENQHLDASRQLAGPVPADIVAYVKQAIDEGDRLPNSCLGSPAKRRALIVDRATVQGTWTSVSRATIDRTDVKLVHEMLIESEYEPCNIRILCDVCKGFNGIADPTKENIFSSLEWLVSGTRPGDYRFLDFSGHGDRLLSDSLRGKEARVVKVDPPFVIPGDYELHGVMESPERIKEQTIPITELVYYNEGIVTRVSKSRDVGDQEPQDEAKIWDSELNTWLSQLPEDSMITCIIDRKNLEYVTNTAKAGPFAHPKFTDLNHKLLGAGWRGKTSQAMFNEPSSTSAGLVVNTALESDETAGSLISPVIATIASALSLIPQIVSSPATITLLEGIPVRERDMDRIRARIFAWAACHQRQRAWDSMDSPVGLLTHSFIQTWRRLTGTDESPSTFSYNQLFEGVSQAVSQERLLSTPPSPQFVQLWTSLKEVDRHLHVSMILL
ncbi:hypothetical protein CTheo_8698 [Ceratobasidium theobromae]|uniref:Uncharacterized protein n=1 Tax=Ceratobasidium theobromae TaxID=1582974 RepID=A0A5N5Q847_9AGAM|nr:hypothetical protein CTheo_8698 [Ceratobasidium theobromae]